MRNGRFYVRRRVPAAIVCALGVAEVWASLRTDSLRAALRRYPFTAAQIEARFERARRTIGEDADLTLDGSLAASAEEAGCHSEQGLTFAAAYERYMSDPTHTWSDSTRRAYETTREVAISVFGSDTAARAITRLHAREFIQTLRHLPLNARKRFPDMSPREAANMAQERGDLPAISAANANAYIGNLSSFLNWAVDEEVIDRNPVRGLRLPDDVAKRDKRYPFSAEQLRLIFSAPLYRGCENGRRGYSMPGSEKPQNARFWIPIIALHSGMRLNEICQLDVSDLRVLDGVPCFVVTKASLVGTSDKRLKTGASERVIPLHRTLLELGLPDHAAAQQRAGHAKIFHDIEAGPREVRAVAFSKWFTQFLRNATASRPRTSFHSFRHNFRDSLRAARIEHDVAMALGGWVGGSTRSAVSDSYGSGYPVKVLKEAMDRIDFPAIGLSRFALQPDEQSGAGIVALS